MKAKESIMTIAQQLKIKEFPFEIRDSKGNLIYFERSDGYWHRCEFDSNGKSIYCEQLNGYWAKIEFDSEGKEIYFENSNGILIDDRHKSPKTELTLDEIAQMFSIPVSQLKIKK